MPDMRLFEDRKVVMRDFVNDAVSTFPESVKFLYHWYQYEMALIKRDRIKKKISHHAKSLNDMQTVVDFRKELQDL